jgi:hypothetical protein
LVPVFAADQRGSNRQRAIQAGEPGSTALHLAPYVLQLEVTLHLPHGCT